MPTSPIANFENPAPNTWRFHSSGTVFSANPANIAAVEDAGFDWVSMANNHIGDAGDNGILQTMKNLDKHDIAHAGAGTNFKAAHKASLLEVGRRDGRPARLRHDRADVLGGGRQPGQRAHDRSRR